MSTINKYVDLNAPFSEGTAAKLLGKILQKDHLQTTAATLAGAVMWVADFAGLLGDAYVTMAVLPGAGESMVFDLLKNGASVLTGTLTVNNSTTSKGQLKLAIDPNKASFVPGDVITCSRTYTAGAGAMTDTQVSIEPSYRSYVNY